MDAPRITRRRLLAGGGAVVVAAGGAAAGLRGLGSPQRLLDELGGACGEDGKRPPRADPPPSVREGTIATANAAGGKASYLLSRPPREPVGLLVHLPGRGGVAQDADLLGLPDLCAPFGLAVASIDGGESYYHPRRDGRDGARLVLDDLLGLALRELGRLPRVVMGTSMGGYGAALLAQQQPKAFRGVVVSSGAIWRSARDTAPGAFDGAADFAAHDVLAHAGALRELPVRVDCGTADPFLAGNRAFARATGAAAAFTPGCHDRGFWRRVAPAQVAWAAGVLSAGR